MRQTSLSLLLHIFYIHSSSSSSSSVHFTASLLLHQDKASQTASIRQNRHSTGSSDRSPSPSTPTGGSRSSSAGPKMVRRIPVEDDPILQAIEKLNLNKRAAGGAGGGGGSGSGSAGGGIGGAGAGGGYGFDSASASAGPDDDTANAQKVIADAVNAIMNIETPSSSTLGINERTRPGVNASPGRSGRIRLMPHEARAIPVQHVRSTPSPPPSPRPLTPSSSLNSSAFSLVSGPPSPTPSDPDAGSAEGTSGFRFPGYGHHLHHHHHPSSHHHHQQQQQQQQSERRPLSAMSGQGGVVTPPVKESARKSIPVQVFHSGSSSPVGRSPSPSHHQQQHNQQQHHQNQQRHSENRAESPSVVRQIPVMRAGS